MKKLLLGSGFLVFVLFLTATSSVNAVCRKLESGKSCLSFEVACAYNYCCEEVSECPQCRKLDPGEQCFLPAEADCGNGYCCQTLNDCSSVPLPTIQPPPPGGGTTRKDIFETQVLCNGNGVRTAIGCIPIEQETFLAFILGWAIGIGGGIAFLLILYAGFIIMTSTGNPERLKGGQQLLTSAIGGLILLVFSVFILRVIGVDILGIF